MAANAEVHVLGLVVHSYTMLKPLPVHTLPAVFSLEGVRSCFFFYKVASCRKDR